MSQIVVSKNIHGIVLVAENRAMELDEEGKEVSFQMNRLISLGPSSALLTSGATEGTGMANALKLFVQEEGLKDVEEIYAASLPFLSAEYERFMRKKCEWLPIDPIHHVSFVLAGRTEKDEGLPYRSYFIWTKKKLPLLDGDEISYALCLPRRMGLEFQLNKMCREDASPKEILRKIVEGMKHLNDRGEVGSSFSFAVINATGYHSLNP